MFLRKYIIDIALIRMRKDNDATIMTLSVSADTFKNPTTKTKIANNKNKTLIVICEAVASMNFPLSSLPSTLEKLM